MEGPWGIGVMLGSVLELRPLADDGTALGIKTLLHLDVHDRRGCRLDIPERLLVSRRIGKTRQSFDFGASALRGKHGQQMFDGLAPGAYRPPSDTQKQVRGSPAFAALRPPPQKPSLLLPAEFF